MKKIFIYATLVTFLSTACNLDINDDPNNPKDVDVTADLVLPSAENYIANALGDQMFSYAGFFAQYFEQQPEFNQYNHYAELQIDEGTQLLDRTYRNLYAGAFEDLADILSRTDNQADRYVCTILRVWGYQIFVDNVSDAPYTEALKGAALTMPKWDDGKTIFEGLLAELDQAEHDLSDSQMNLKDPLLRNDMSQWRGFANALRLRIYLRLIDAGIDAASYTKKIVALASKGHFFKNDITYNVFSNAEGQYAPWYDAIFALKACNYCAAYPLVSYMLSTADPRIGYAMKRNEKKGMYVGQIPGTKSKMKEWTNETWKNENVSAIDADKFKAEPIYVFTQSELQFLLAEVFLRFANRVHDASKAYRAAVEADFKSRGVEKQCDEFLTNKNVDFDQQPSVSEQLNLIYMQKWVAFFMRNHMEAWSEQRRTDVPAVSKATAQEVLKGSENYTPGDLIVPAVNNIQGGGLAKRVPYPSNARRFNKNTPEEKKMSVRVFWDVK